MSLLTIVQNASSRIGLTSPTVVYTSSDLQITQLLALAQQEGRELARRHPWEAITKEQTFTSVALEDQTTASAIPSDFDRMINDTFYNRSKTRPVVGPISSQEWQFEKAVVATTIVEHWRQRGDAIHILPIPTAGNTYAFEYVSTKWCQSNASVAQTSWAADADTGILSEELMTLGVIWRFKQKKGLDYAEDFRTYEIQVAQKITSDGGKRTLNAAGRHGLHRARVPYIPDGSWSL